ncbi:MAG: hypothetical protein OXH63_20600 [Gemmatimonadetes bacterium]|nr:hypothetical protein [Gemmatimonadota bacterium]
MPLTAGSTGSYGLVVSGDGLVAYVDAAFSVAVGQGPVDLVVETQLKAGGEGGAVGACGGGAADGVEEGGADVGRVARRCGQQRPGGHRRWAADGHAPG